MTVPWMGNQRYEVLGALGRGGMGQVLRAHDRQLGRDVAIKLLDSRWSEDPDLHRRLRREALAMARVRHPNLLGVLDVLEPPDPAGLVLQLVPGTTLAAHLEAHGPMDPEEARRLGVALAGALQAIHEEAILHRDVKPENIMVTPRGEPILMDLGLASLLDGSRLTETGVVVGSPRYLAPEVFQDGEYSWRTDQFQLGAVLFEALTGVPLIPGRTPDEAIDNLMAGRREDLRRHREDVGRDLRRAIERATARRPGDRFPTLEALVDALEERGPPRPERTMAATVTGEVPLSAPPARAATPAEPSPEIAPPSGLRAGLAFGVLVACGLALLVALAPADEEPAGRPGEGAPRQLDPLETSRRRLASLVGPFDEDPTPRYRDAFRDGEPLSLAPARDHWRSLAQDIEGLLHEPGPRGPREARRTWTRWQRVLRSLQQERLLGQSPPPLGELPPQTSGDPWVGPVPGDASRSVEMVGFTGGQPETWGPRLYYLRAESLLDLPAFDNMRAATELLGTWPGVPESDPAFLAVDFARLDPRLQLLVDFPDHPAAPTLALWVPTAPLGSERLPDHRGWLSLRLPPVEWLPPAGARVRFRLDPLVEPSVIVARIRAIQVR